MLLSARFLNQVSSVNAFEYVSNAQWTAGDTVTLYFQLIDLNLDKPVQGFQPAGRRYMPAAGATLSVKLDNINDAIAVTRSATQPYPQDSSIWAVQILSTDTIRGTCDLVLNLTESAVKTSGRVVAGVLISTTGCLG